MNFKVITISREYGSGGRLIGRQLADRLGVAFYDKELIRLAAEKSGFSARALEQAEDKAANSVLYALSSGLANGLGMSLDDQFYLAQFEAVRQVASAGPCVIVGRCANYILRDLPDCAHFFIHADPEIRLHRAMEQYGDAPNDARVKLQRVDKARANYYAHYTTMRWGNAKNYQLTLDSGPLGVERAALLLDTYLKL